MADTIYALSSGGLPSGVAVIRASGPSVADVLAALGLSGITPREAALRTIRDRNNQVIDQALVLHFPAPASFTGEDCLEIQCHGGRAVVARLLDEIGSVLGTRPAEAGEFTRRAFENGKIDLVEAEGLADLVSAETEMQRRLAIEQASGGLSELYHGWAHRLTHARAMIEAELDFADEDDIPGSVSDRIWADMRSLDAEIAAHLAQAKTGEIIRNGLKVALVGRPNAGKSSLLNALARRDVAIVTPLPGTTRDVLSVDLDLNGYAVRLLDTAGIRQTDDVIETEGVSRALRAAAEADLILHLQDMSDPDPHETALPEGKPVLHVGTKLDLAPVLAVPGRYAVNISTRTGEGIDQLHAALAGFLDRMGSNSLAIPSRIRHVHLLTETRASISEASNGEALGLDLRAELLRRAATSLGRITGSVDVEALLDVIFSEFCIGK